MRAQQPGLAVGLEVDARDEPVAEQERQHVVAVDALGLRDVDLELEAEAEQALDAAALPQQVVERAEQRAGVDAARDAGVAVQVGGHVPALDLDREQLARLHQLGDARADRVGGEPEVVAQLGQRGDARARARRSPTSSRCASSSLGVGASSTACGSTRSGRS